MSRYIFSLYYKIIIFILTFIDLVYRQWIKNPHLVWLVYLSFISFILVWSSTVVTYAAPVSTPYITDITTVRLYDKLFVEGFGKWISQPRDLTQIYTSFIYEYKFDLFRWGAYDDNNGYLDGQYLHLKNYDQAFLSANRFACKELWVYRFEILEPAPVNYFYRTFYLVGQEAATGIPFKLALHDSQVVGTFLLDSGAWQLQSGINPFIDGLDFKTVKILNGVRVLDLLYYIDGAIDSYLQPLALDERIRVYILRDIELAYLPPRS